MPDLSPRVVAICLAIAACGSGTGPSEVPAARIEVLAGGGSRDTIDAVLDTALRIRVRRSGDSIAAHVVVRFASLLRTERKLSFQPYTAATTFVGTLTSPNVGTLAVDSTSSEGIASIRVVLGEDADTGGVIVSVPELGLVDTVRYLILPGHPVTLVMTPADTTVTVGHSLHLTAVVVDRLSNPVQVPIVFQASSDSLTVSAQGDVTAGVPVRGFVVARATGIARMDTAGVSVVPAGTIAAVQTVTLGGGLAILDLDGSNGRAIPVPIQPFDVGPEWAPDLQSLAVVGNGFLFNVTLAGAATSLTENSNVIGPVQGVDYAPDGAWIYFSAPTCNNSNGALFKVAPGGGALIRLSPSLAGALTECGYLNQRYPSVSPDGTRLLFENDSVTPSLIQVMALGAGTINGLGVTGSRPRWSPSGSQIAYNADSAVWVMNADGTSPHEISPAGKPFAPGVAWSPAGDWLLVREVLTPFLSTRIDLLNLATSQLIPLPYTAGYYAYALPAWRRDPQPSGSVRPARIARRLPAAVP